MIRARGRRRGRRPGERPAGGRDGACGDVREQRPANQARLGAAQCAACPVARACKPALIPSGEWADRRPDLARQADRTGRDNASPADCDDAARRTRARRPWSVEWHGNDSDRGRTGDVGECAQDGRARRNAALEAWGAHYRDNPFAVFADVRRRGAVHPVTLVDGHEAWLVVRYDEARAALNDHAAVEGHARRPGRRRGRRVRGSSRTRLRPTHAHRRSAGSHPAPPAGLERLLAAAHRGTTATNPDDRRRSARRHRRGRRRQPGRSRLPLRVPAAVHRHL